MSKLDPTFTADLQTALSAEKPNPEEITQAFMGMQKKIETDLLQKMQESNGDARVLEKIGFGAIASDERKFALELKEAQKIESGQSFANVDQVVPPTTVNRVMENLVKNHPLIGAVDTITGGLSTEFVYSIGVNTAFWGAITAPVKELADKGFRKMQIGQLKLSAYLPVAKAFLDFNSPEWLIAYITTVLSESIAIALETAIVDGNGDGQPIGMRRSLVNATSGAQDVIASTEIADFSPATLGSLMATLSNITVDTKNDIQLERTIDPTNMAIIMNPTTYWNVFYKETTIQNANGAYVTNLALPFQVLQSTAVPENEFIIGLPKDYLLVVNGGTRLGFSDEHLYIQDERVYLAKTYANGTPKGENMFLRTTLSTTDGKKAK